MASPRAPLHAALMTLLTAIVDTSARVAATSSRLAKVRELAATLGVFDAGEIAIGVAYLAGSLPQGKIGLSWRVLQSATGGIGAPSPLLALDEVDQRLTVIAGIRGNGSAAARTGALAELFARATADEQAFLVRLIVGELRQGALEGVMVDAIAAASGLPVADVRRAAMFAPGLGALATAALLDGPQGLARFQLDIFSPVVPMLAQTAADVAEALDDLGRPVQFEWKMDGARIQVHRRGDDVRIFTRALNEVTAAIPEIVAAVRGLPATEFVLDGEVIAFDSRARPHPFQTTMRRFGRKLNVAALLEELPLNALFFDCLRLGDESLVGRPLAERCAKLDGFVPETMRMPRLITDVAETATQFHDAALAAGHEGVMAKAPGSPYEAGNRGASWLKIKRAHTLDLVVIGAEWGHGRRKGRLSNLHLGALDPETGEYVMLGKTFKGLTDAMLEWQTRELLARELRRDGITVFVRPELVAEIAFSDLQASPRYPAGIALRLARVKRYRDDKNVDQADALDTVRRIFAAQAG